MIKLETQANERVYAIPDTSNGYSLCDSCHFDGTNRCCDVMCNKSERADETFVYFRPLTDVRVAVQYARQQRKTGK